MGQKQEFVIYQTVIVLSIKRGLPFLGQPSFYFSDFSIEIHNLHRYSVFPDGNWLLITYSAIVHAFGIIDMRLTDEKKK